MVTFAVTGTIMGPTGVAGATVSGDTVVRGFAIVGNAAAIGNLTLANGNAADGGGILTFWIIGGGARDRVEPPVASAR